MKRLVSIRQPLRSSSRLAFRSVHTVLLFGDSLTWCYDPEKSTSTFASRISFDKRWTTYLSEHLGNQYLVVTEGLNGRTTVFKDPIPPGDGDYNCCGRDILTTILHTHKPVSTVVLALGVNDLKKKFNATHQDIVGGIKLLIRDVQRSTDIGAGQLPPRIIVLGPPILHSTPTSSAWGYEKDVDEKSKKLSAILGPVCRSMGVTFLNLGKVASVNMKDGIHFDVSVQHKIASAVSHTILSLGEKVQKIATPAE